MAVHYIGIAAALFLTVFCWWFIARSASGLWLKLMLLLIVSVPFVGPFIYLFSNGPKRQVPPNGTAYLREWNEREHVYLGWTSVVLWVLAFVAWWMNDWKPGEIRQHF